MPLKDVVRAVLAVVVGIYLSAVPASAQDDKDFTGTWLAVHDVNGVVLPHFEMLRVGSGGDATVEIYAARQAEKCEVRDQLAPPDCRNPFIYARGKLAVEPGKSTLVLTQTKLASVQIAGWSESDVNLAPLLFWFGKDGARWQYARQGNRLSVEQQVAVPAQLVGQAGNDVVNTRIAKQLVRVDAEFAGDLISLLVALDVSVLEGYCIVDAFGSPAPASATFRDFLAKASKGARAVTNLRKSVFEADVEKAILQSRAAAALWIDEAKPGDPVPAAVAAGLGADAARLNDFLTARASLADSTIAASHMFPGLEPHAATMTACRDKIRR